jgi:peptidoglycan/LPS O-acetylase OafA/YrhL
MRKRDQWLDLLRASAITMVVIYHIAQRWPVPVPRVRAVTDYGIYGVDLFFVLSGWLIGGLLWREQKHFGNVETGRFILRRALRTVPPYLVALAISYVGVFVFRHERFDWGYLLFFQNYYERIPYFLVSWSLCIEEHFYLVMPFVAVALTRRRPRFHFLLLALALGPVLFRTLEPGSGAEDQFGYHVTATHLRYEGLLLGVWASFLQVQRPRLYGLARTAAPLGIVVALIGIVVCELLPEPWHYRLIYTAIAFFFFFVLLSAVDRSWSIPFGRLVFLVAAASYSIYLTHAFILDIALRVAAKLPPLAIIQLPLFLGLIGITGLLFYRAVELPSLRLRHNLMPARTKDLSPLLQTEAVPTDAEGRRRN